MARLASTTNGPARTRCRSRSSRTNWKTRCAKPALRHNCKYHQGRAESSPCRAHLSGMQLLDTHQNGFWAGLVNGMVGVAVLLSIAQVIRLGIGAAGLFQG